MGIEEDDAGWMAVEREPLLVESRSWSEQPVCINGSDQDAPATINTGCNPSNTDENSPLINGNEPLADTRFHVYLASLAFLILFVAYNSLQNYATSLLPNDLGNESLAILYITVPIFCFMGPPIIRRLGEKWTMVLGSSTYAFFMATLIKPIRTLVLVASTVIGFGSAILWISIGPYLKKASTPKTVAGNNAIFWGIFQFSNVIGNITAYFVFNKLGGSTALFIGLTAIGAFSVILFGIVKRTSSFKHNSDISEEKKHRHTSVWRDIKATLRVMQSNQMLLLIYLSVFTGYELGFWSGEFSQMLPSSTIGLVLCFAGVGEIIGGIVYTAGLAIASLMVINQDNNDVKWEGVTWMAYVAAFSFGFGDSTLNTQLYTLIGKITTNESTVKAFTVYQIFQNIGSAASFYCSAQFPMHGSNANLAQVYFQVVLLFIGMVSFIRADMLYSPRSRKSV
eukprot:gene9656-1870_t